MNTGKIKPFGAVISSISGAVVGLALSAGLYYGWEHPGPPATLLGLCLPWFLLWGLLGSLIVFFMGPPFQWAFTGFALYGALVRGSLRLLSCIFLIGVAYIASMGAVVYQWGREDIVLGGCLGAAFYLGAGLTVFRYRDRIRNLFAGS